MYYICKVSRKGQITIPVKLRRKYNIRSEVALIEEDGKIILVPLIPFEELFGIDGEKALETAKELLANKVREIKLEKKIRD